MLYLADVRHDSTEKMLTLKLLAQQQAETAWKVLSEQEIVELRSGEAPVSVGIALVELSDDRKTAQVQDATDWLLSVVRSFLATGVTAEFLQHESERAEQWRQSLTLQSQELGRRTLELEARMGQIQELEEKLQQDRQDLDGAEVAEAGTEEGADAIG